MTSRQKSTKQSNIRNSDPISRVGHSTFLQSSARPFSKVPDVDAKLIVNNNTEQVNFCSQPKNSGNEVISSLEQEHICLADCGEDKDRSGTQKRKVYPLRATLARCSVRVPVLQWADQGLRTVSPKRRLRHKAGEHRLDEPLEVVKEEIHLLPMEPTEAVKDFTPNIGWSDGQLANALHWDGKKCRQKRNGRADFSSLIKLLDGHDGDDLLLQNSDENRKETEGGMSDKEVLAVQCPSGHSMSGGQRGRDGDLALSREKRHFVHFGRNAGGSEAMFAAQMLCGSAKRRCGPSNDIQNGSDQPQLRPAGNGVLSPPLTPPPSPMSALSPSRVRTGGNELLLAISCPPLVDRPQCEGGSADVAKVEIGAGGPTHPLGEAYTASCLYQMRNLPTVALTRPSVMRIIELGGERGSGDSKNGMGIGMVEEGSDHAVGAIRQTESMMEEDEAQDSCDMAFDDAGEKAEVWFNIDVEGWSGEGESKIHVESPDENPYEIQAAIHLLDEYLYSTEGFTA